MDFTRFRMKDIQLHIRSKDDMELMMLKLDWLYILYNMYLV